MPYSTRELHSNLERINTLGQKFKCTTNYNWQQNLFLASHQ